MVPQDQDSTEQSAPDFVYCSECGAKASSDWSFCRSCEGSLDDAEPADEVSITPTDRPEGTAGCPKCGHDDVETATVAVTSDGMAVLFDVQDQQFRAVSCARCGYTEFYRGSSRGTVVDLFIGE